MLYVRKKKINVSSLISLFIFLEPGRKNILKRNWSNHQVCGMHQNWYGYFFNRAAPNASVALAFASSPASPEPELASRRKWQISSCSRRKQKAKYLFQLIPSSFSLRPASVINQLPNPDLNSAWKRCRKLASGSKQSKFKNLQTVQAAGSLSPHFYQYLQCYPIIHPLSPSHWWLMMALNPYNSCTVGCWKPLWLPHLHWDHGNRGCPATGSRWQPRHHQQLSEYIWIIFPPIWGTPESLV